MLGSPLGYRSQKTSSFHQFLSRFFHPRHVCYYAMSSHHNKLDLEFACWKFANLLLDPTAVFKNTRFNKGAYRMLLRYSTDTKNQYAKDDPSFVLILFIFMISATLGT